MSQLLFDNVARYRPEADSGGDLRHNQVYETIAASGLELACTDLDTRSRDRLRGALTAFRRVIPAIRTVINPFNLRTMLALGHAGKVWDALEEKLRSHPETKCVVCDSIVNWTTGYFARQNGLPWIAIPQNFEVFWSGRDLFLNRTYWQGVQFEADLLRTASAVFAISYEEQYLLANLGIPADVLLYYPPKDQSAKLLLVREARVRRDTSVAPFILLLGTAAYPPTRDGLLDVTASLAPLFSQGSPVRIVVAGRGSEAMRAQLPAFVEILGTVTNEQLTTLMRQARALLVHQTYGGGAITRIADALVAGLPVLANPIAARSARTYDGVHVYHDAEELLALMKSELPMPPIPPRPLAAEQRLIATLRKFVACGQQA